MRTDVDWELDDMFALPEESFAKGGSSLRGHLAFHHKTLAAEHAQMHAHFYDAHNSVDDGHELKAHYRKLMEHHKALHEHHKAMHESFGGGDVNVGDLHGPKVRKDGIRPDGVKLIPTSDVASHLRLIPRAGMQNFEKVSVDPELEDMFPV